MTKYYFIGTLLPDLHLEQPAPISFARLMLFLQDNLTAKDYRQVIVLRGYFDLENLRQFWKGGALDIRGALDKKELEEALLCEELLPPYVRNFLEKYEGVELRLLHFPELLSAYFRQESASTNYFLRSYLTFERQLRLFQTTFRAMHLNRSLQKELLYENFDEEFVRTLYEMNEDACQYLHPLSAELEEIHKILIEFSRFPLKLYQSLSRFRFNYIQQLVGDELYSLDRILGYTAQLIIVEQWSSLDRQTGMNKLVQCTIKD